MNYYDRTPAIQAFCQQIENDTRFGINQKSIQRVEKKLAEYPQHPDLLFLMGKLFFYLNEWLKASKYFYQAVKAKSTVAEHFAFYGWTLFKLNDVEMAKTYLEKAYNLNSEDVTTCLVLGIVSYKEKEFSVALNYCNKGIYSGLHEHEFFRLKANCYLNMGKPIDEIIPIIERAQKLGEDHQLDYEYAKLLFINQQMEDCNKFCRKFMLKYPQSVHKHKFQQIMNKIKENNNAHDKQSKNQQGTNEQKQRTPKRINELLDELNQFIGLENVKNSIQEMINLLEINRFKEERGLKATPPVAPHMVFYGNPGTGKTTIARLIGDIFHSLGLLKQGHLVEVKREDLVGQFIGDTEKNTKEKIEEALGGVLFIDEAYTLAEKSGKGSNDFGVKAINVLLPALTNHRGEFIVIAAGYKEEMEMFLASNPGLKDRFTNKIHFDDYTPSELMDIFNKLCEDKGNILDENASRLLVEEFTRLYRKRDKTFSNGRLVHNYFERIVKVQSNRIIQVPKEQWNDELMVKLTEDDVRSVLPKEEGKLFEIPINEELLQEKLAQLDSMIGLQSVKEEIYQLVSLVRYYKQEKKNLKKLIKHVLLLGNPGTGKTEVARILAVIYEALGILERGELIEIDRNGLVDKYRGGTEEKTMKVIAKAMGGTLFIDEAYTLTNKDRHDPGHAALEILLKKMSDLEGQFMVIAAGYNAEMEQFLASNSGLPRRFGLTLHFEDYTPSELMEISKYYLSGYQLSASAETLLNQHYEHMYQTRNKTFGNAGFARKVISESIKNLDYRVSQLPSEELTEEIKKTIEPSDIATLTN
ncbi:AAA family ATPase [Alkalihalobacillus sp. LMS39]|uniref:AAA family ATPase n=1 Tax=Alkalihalobacillus sp. LMS39 TaxID=2924032 RepID=UPI001FB4DCF0|nr:AAA family ATPase [Alkalihalobacillus sp. LMS39]UOE94785.1 AAA family ATPase [Alkalihalobacillus sp. LMS39]